MTLSLILEFLNSSCFLNELTVSIVGGGRGGRLSLEAVAASGSYRPVAVADLRPEVGAELSRKYAELRVFAEYQEMFQNSLHQRHLENLLPMIASGTPDYSLPESSLEALEICEAAYLSARHGVEVRFPLDPFEIPARNDWEPGQPYLGLRGGRDGRKRS